MAHADVKSWIETFKPNQEVVALSIGASGSTYPSRKFNFIQAAQATSNSASSGTIGVTFSAGTIATINHAGGSGSVTLVLWGE
jgi:hypothetical protein